MQEYLPLCSTKSEGSSLVSVLFQAGIEGQGLQQKKTMEDMKCSDVCPFFFPKIRRSINTVSVLTNLVTLLDNWIGKNKQPSDGTDGL